MPWQLRINRLCKMIAATIQERQQHLLQRNNDHHNYYSKTRQFYDTNNSVCYILFDRYKFS